jgi:hypothetical protein
MSKFRIMPHGRLQEWVAEEKGYFKDEGLEYEFVRNGLLAPDATVRSAADAPGGIMTGAFESMEAGRACDVSSACHWAVNMASSADHGRMWGHAYSVTLGGIYVPPESDVRTPEDLRTVEIGVGFHSGSHFSTLQALELVNGEIHTRWLSRAARRMLGELPPEPRSLYNRTVAGRYAAAVPFDIDVSKARVLWLVVQDYGSNAPDVVQPLWRPAEFVDADGRATALSSLTPANSAGLRAGVTPASAGGPSGGVRVKNPSVMMYDVGDRGFTRVRGAIGLENASSEIGSTLNPQLRFFVFDAAPNMERLVPPAPEPPLPPPPVLTTSTEIIDRVFRHALGRAPSAGERQLAENALRVHGALPTAQPRGPAVGDHDVQSFS